MIYIFELMFYENRYEKRKWIYKDNKAIMQIRIKHPVWVKIAIKSVLQPNYYDFLKNWKEGKKKRRKEGRERDLRSKLLNYLNFPCLKT